MRLLSKTAEIHVRTSAHLQHFGTWNTPMQLRCTSVSTNYGAQTMECKVMRQEELKQDYIGFNSVFKKSNKIMATKWFSGPKNIFMMDMWHAPSKPRMYIKYVEWTAKIINFFF